MATLQLDIKTKQAVQAEFINALRNEGLILVPEKYAHMVAELEKKQYQALKAKTITPYKIAKLSLIPGANSIKTITDMIADGRIGVNEWFKDANNKTYVMVSAVKRLRDE